jgi:DNA polymerase
METRRLQYLDAMGIQAWERRMPTAPRQVEVRDVRDHRDDVRGARYEENPEPAPTIHETQNLKPVAAGDVSALDWAALQQRVQNCTLCSELVASRTQTVFGVGDAQAQWLVIGEAPGADEDAQGEPFVGRAGQLLNAMLLAIGLQREQVYIANVLKCRPPNNRDPKPDEAANCEPFLLRQIALLQPRIILAVGRIAAQNLLKTDTPIGKLRGRVHRYGDIPLVVTYHPAYLLRSPSEKRKAWDDLRLAVSSMQQGAGV